MLSPLISVLIACCVGFVCGSLPFGLWITKINRQGDIRTKGSKNIGATNVARVVGKKAAALTFAADLLKGFLSTYTFSDFGSTELAYLCGLSAVLGHIFSPLLKFRGGKGISTSFGVMLCAAPLLACVGIASWVSLFIITRFASLSSLFGMLVMFIGSFYLYNAQISTLMGIIVLLTFFTHRSNIQRLLKKEEHKLLK